MSKIKFDAKAKTEDQNTENPPEEKPEAEQNPETQKEETEKKTFIDRQYEKYCMRREKKAEKKANKKPRTKGEKAALIGGGTLLITSLALGAGKAFIQHYADVAEADELNVSELPDGEGSGTDLEGDQMTTGEF